MTSVSLVLCMGDSPEYIPKASEEAATIQVIQRPCASLKAPSQAEEQAA